MGLRGYVGICGYKRRLIVSFMPTGRFQSGSTPQIGLFMFAYYCKLDSQNPVVVQASCEEEAAKKLLKKVGYRMFGINGDIEIIEIDMTLLGEVVLKEMEEIVKKTESPEWTWETTNNGIRRGRRS